MITYEQWNKAIISYFFEEHDDPDQIVFLQTDAVTLSEIAELSDFNVGDAAESLKEAVKNKVVFYDLVILSKINPTKVEEEPTQVAFLALTVLAASEMKNSSLLRIPERTRFWEPNPRQMVAKRVGIYRAFLETPSKHGQTINGI